MYHIRTRLIVCVRTKSIKMGWDPSFAPLNQSIYTPRNEPTLHPISLSSQDAIYRQGVKISDEMRRNQLKWCGDGCGCMLLLRGGLEKEIRLVRSFSKSTASVSVKHYLGLDWRKRIISAGNKLRRKRIKDRKR
jgi:hypothetical protein